MSASFVRVALLVALISHALNVSALMASQPPMTFPDGRTVPGGSCGMGVTSQSERAAILTLWLVVPSLAGATSLLSAVIIRRRLRFVSDQRRRTRMAALVGILGAVALTLGIYVLLVGGLHTFDVFSLYEPMF